MGIWSTEERIVLENRYVRLELANENGRVVSIYAKENQKEIVGEETYFFSLVAKDKVTEVLPHGLRCEGDQICVRTELGEFCVRVEVREEFLVFELISNLPEECYKACLAHARYRYEWEEKQSVGATGMAMTWWANPCFYPDAKAKETKVEVLQGLKEVGAKYGVVIAPMAEHRRILKEVSRKIDKQTGIVSELGGAWAKDAPINRGNYIIQWENSLEFIQKNLEFYKALHVDEIDFHGSVKSFAFGDFRYRHYKNGEEFRETTGKLLAEHGIGAGFHTYACFIAYECEGILADPKWQKDLDVAEQFVLGEDIDAEAGEIPLAELSESMNKENGYLICNSPFLRIGEELIRIDLDSDGVKVVERGAAGTKAVAHCKGELVYHLNGLFYHLVPALGSELFFWIARKTAEEYNEGGYRMLYLDALDGILLICNGDEDLNAYYMSAFVCEVLKHCKTTPILEYSIRRPCLWAGRGRIGNFDTPHRGYKNWNGKLHLEMNRDFMDMYCLPSLGWYCFYSVCEEEPGNLHTKYQHTDAVESMGALAVAHDFNIVYTETDYEDYRRYPAVRRNIEIYTRCDRLRKERYFSPELLEKVRQEPGEVHIVATEYGYQFVQKEYSICKLYDLADASRNRAVFENPFEEQVPFLRIEALLSGKQEDAEVLLAFDPEKELGEQKLVCKFDKQLDLSRKMARKIAVHGNGKDGSAIAVKLRSKHRGYMLFVIDTNFEGWREFVLAESDNGERLEFPFEANEGRYNIYRWAFRHDQVTEISVETAGDVRGVRVTEIAAIAHQYEVLKNPTVKIGETQVTFECELTSTEYIEFDGKTAKAIDRYGNERTVAFRGEILAPAGQFVAELSAWPQSENMARAQLTVGFTGRIIQ